MRRCPEATRADLSNARLSSQLTGAKLDEADLFKAVFGACDLTGTSLRWANLSDANFAPDSPSTPSIQGEPDRARLTQQQLDQAVADPLQPPTIAEGTIDIETGEPVEWNDGNELPEWLEIRNGHLVRKKRKHPITRDRDRSNR